MSSPNRPFAAAVRSSAQAAILDLHGEINGAAEAALAEAYAAAVATGHAAILLNFTDVSYINSTGIALIVGLLAQARKAKRRLATYGLSDHYVEIFRITRLSDFMDIEPDEAGALAALES